MRRYEAMFIVRPDLNEDGRKNLLARIKEIITKNNGKVISSDIWAEKKRLYFSIKKHKEGSYYLVNFQSQPENISNLNHDFKLADDILRVLITACAA